MERDQISKRERSVDYRPKHLGQSSRMIVFLPFLSQTTLLPAPAPPLLSRLPAAAAAPQPDPPPGAGLCRPAPNPSPARDAYEMPLCWVAGEDPRSAETAAEGSFPSSPPDDGGRILKNSASSGAVLSRSSRSLSLRSFCLRLAKISRKSRERRAAARGLEGEGNEALSEGRGGGGLGGSCRCRGTRA